MEKACLDEMPSSHFDENEGKMIATWTPGLNFYLSNR